MKTDAIIWGLIPTIIAVANMATSVFILFRPYTKMRAFAAGLAFGLSAWGTKVLYAIFVRDAWATAIGHIAILAASIMCILLLVFTPKRKNHGAEPAATDNAV